MLIIFMLFYPKADREVILCIGLNNTVDTGVAPIGPGLHFISKNKTSKFAIKIERGVTQAGLGGASGA